jgi:hypothetical protein
MAERLADRPALRLEQLARAAILLPTFRKFADANLGEPGFAVAQQDAERAPRHPEPAALAFRHRREDVVEAALLAADLIGDVTHVRQALGVEVRPVVHGVDDVGAGAGLDRRGDARLQVVAVDGLERDLEPQRLLRLRQQLLAQQRVGGGNEIAEPQPVQRGVLRVGGRPAGGQDAGQRAAADQRAARSLEEFATINSHGASSVL